ASAVITGGNSTAVLGALTHGLPLLILPGGGEQHEAAESCTAAGVALSLERDKLSSAAITAALSQLMTESAFTRESRRLAGVFEAYKGPHRASRLLEAMGARVEPFAPGAVACAERSLG